MTFIDWFAGVGGFRRGLELAGHKCVGFCEWDKFATASYTSMHLLTDEQRKYLATLPLNKRQKEILKEEYRNGEWYADDIRGVDGGQVPAADCWCFGAPCQDFSVAGLRAGLDGDRSSLVKEIFRLLREKREQDRPEWLIYENVKGMLSSNGGWDYLSILAEMDELGYDIQWQLFNRKDFAVPHNRERVYTIGHFRERGPAKVFPIEGTDGENSVDIKLLGHRKGYHRNTQVFSDDGITETLSTCEGGGREHFTAIPINVSLNDGIIGGGYNGSECSASKGLQRHTGQAIYDRQCFIDYNRGGDVSKVSNTIKARYDAGVSNQRKDRSAVVLPLGGVYTNQQEKFSRGLLPQLSRTLKADSHPSGVALALPIIYDDYNSKLRDDNLSCSLTSNCGSGAERNGMKVCVPVLTPDRVNKRQHGRRFKDNGEESFTLTGEDRHGVMISVDGFNTEDDGTCRNLRVQNIPANMSRQDAFGVSGAVVKGVGPGKGNQGIAVTISENCTVYAVWSERFGEWVAIRKLTPRECFRLQGWTDDYFDKAAFVNSNSQLYKQAGNGVTVTVVKAVGDAINKAMEGE